MKASVAGRCVILGLAIFSLYPQAIASAPTSDMQMALDRMVEVQGLDAQFPLEGQADGEALEVFQRTGEALIALNKDWNAAQQGLARQVFAELAPEVVATVHVERQLLLKRIAPEMFRETYPRYFSAAELGQLAAYYDSPTYRKMRPIMSRVEREASRTGADKLALWRAYAPGALSVEELAELRAFRVSELGRKLDAVTPQLYRDWGVFWRSRVRTVIDTAASAYKAELLRRMAERQAAALPTGSSRD